MTNCAGTYDDKPVALVINRALRDQHRNATDYNTRTLAQVEGICHTTVQRWFSLFGDKLHLSQLDLRVAARDLPNVRACGAEYRREHPPGLPDAGRVLAKPQHRTISSSTYANVTKYRRNWLASKVISSVPSHRDR